MRHWSSYNVLKFAPLVIRFSLIKLTFSYVRLSLFQFEISVSAMKKFEKTQLNEMTVIFQYLEFQASFGKLIKNSGSLKISIFFGLTVRGCGYRKKLGNEKFENKVSSDSA